VAGPSEPAALLCRELCRRGWRAELACASRRGTAASRLALRARQMGVAIHEGFCFGDGRDLSAAAHDVARLSRLIGEGGFQVVHVHGSLDHLLAAVARWRSPSHVPLVRTDHGAREFSGLASRHFLFGPRLTGHLIVLSDRLRALAVDRLALGADRVTTVRGAVDVEEFRPVERLTGMRARFGLGEEDVVIGIVARVRQHRRREDLLAAACRVRRENPRVKIVVLGTEEKDILDRPARELALEGTVCPLSCRADDYRDVLAMLDAGLMLVPGADGSCRAAMQMAAMGLPMIVTRRGVLPDIVADGETGIVVRPKGPDDLAAGLLEVAESEERRRAWGRAARERMVEKFSHRRQAEAVARVYERLTSM
jgi:glycosyltransferase involved in cell wall biosynthesis